MRRWRSQDGEDPLPRRFAEAVAAVEPRYGALVGRLLWNRGIREPDAVEPFLRPTLARGLRSPRLLRDMDRAAARLADAVVGGDRIAVYGDYDVDGLSGAALLVLGLRALGAEPLVHVPHRLRDGHGLRVDALRRLRASGARLVVTADCGTGDGAALAAAAELGLDVIVCDHHETPPARPPAVAVLNPRQPGCAFPFKGLSGAGVAFYLLVGLRMELRARGHAALPDLRPYLDLVALGAVADVVPLREENRVLVAHGLRALERTKRAGLVALKETALVDAASVRAIAFRLAPRLNAAGRVAEPERVVELLTTDDGEAARTIAAELEVHNAERRRLEESAFAEAVALADARLAAGPARAIVVARDGWHPGVVGIVAARLAERYGRPAIVVALDGDTGRASGRSGGDVDLHAAVAAARHLLADFGGHPHAVGFTLARDRVRALAVHLDDALARVPADRERGDELAIDAETTLAAMTPELAAALARLEPHGPGNPEPALLARDVEVQGVGLVGDPVRSHLKLRLRQDGRTLAALGFRLGHLPVRPGMRADVVFTPRLSVWQGVERLRLEVLALRQTAARPAAQAPENTPERAIP